VTKCLAKKAKKKKNTNLKKSKLIVFTIKMSEEKIEFGYWTYRGRGQALRFLLEFTGLPYEDKRYNNDNNDWWDAKKTIELDFPNLPYIIQKNGLHLSQSKAILHHLARITNLMPTQKSDLNRVEIIEFQVDDLREQFRLFCIPLNYLDSKEKYIANAKESFGRVDKFLEKNQQSHWCVKDLSYVDFFVYEVCWKVNFFDSSIFAKCPRILKLMKSFEEIPKIKQYMESSRYLRLPMFGPAIQGFNPQK